MSVSTEEMPQDLKIGIVGCGHLGQAIACCLLCRGWQKENLLLSHKGSPQTKQRLRELGLDSSEATNQRVFEESAVVLLAIRPQDLPELVQQHVAVGSDTLVVSCMAGVPIGELHRLLGTRVLRMMWSGPDTLAATKAVATMFPDHPLLAFVLRTMGVTLLPSATERDLDVFTAGVCLPAALVWLGDSADTEAAIARIAAEHPLFARLYPWAVDVLPKGLDTESREAYIHRLRTKGGVTDAIVSSLAAGMPLDAALSRGIERTREISAQAQATFLPSHNLNGV